MMILTDFYFPDLQSKCNIIIKQKGHGQVQNVGVN